MPEIGEAQESEHQKAPGDAEHGRGSPRNYLIGGAAAVLLTLASFGAASSGLVYAPALPILLAVLAIAQMGIHLVFFLRLSSAPEETNTLLALVFGIFVVGLVVFGSMIIMTDLNHGMKPMNQVSDKNSTD
jgi:cytochrome o ubiquinol oxidase operon protein cyoD